MFDAYEIPPMAELSEAQINGPTCVYCGILDAGPFVPVGFIRGQVFAHEKCAEPHKLEELTS